MSTPSSPPTRPYVIGVDVGTSSVRAGVVEVAGGRIVSKGVYPLRLHHPAPLHYEYSSNQVWSAVCSAVREAVRSSGVSPDQIGAIGFDATCSLVVLGENDEPISVSAQVSPTATADASSSSSDVHNILCWMDHRSRAEAEWISQLSHPILSSLGGRISPEHEIPKTLWLKKHLSARGEWNKVRKLIDLTDWLQMKASGVEARSVCAVTCKYTFQAHLHQMTGEEGQGQKSTQDGPTAASASGGWSDEFFQQIGLEDLSSHNYSLIGSPSTIRPIGSRIGALTPEAAEALGLDPNTIVSVGLIDAHAGGIGMIGARLPKEVAASAEEQQSLQERMAVICGTSSCHLVVTPTRQPVPGVWGPYYSSLVPGQWLLEGGESATGALLDHVVETHPAYPQAVQAAQQQGLHLHDYLNSLLPSLSARRGLAHPSFLTRHVHLLPYHHGNRSPRADPSLLGVMGGLSLDKDVDDLAVKYLATIQALAYGTRHIRETMQKHGVSTRYLFLCGGLAKNPLFVQQHADANSCVCVLPRESDGVLLGAAITAATASSTYPSLTAAMQGMTSIGSVVQPVAPDSEVAQYHARKFRVFLQMYEDEQRWRRIMEGEGEGVREKNGQQQ